LEPTFWTRCALTTTGLISGLYIRPAKSGKNSQESTGTWLGPPDWVEGSIDIAEDLPGILHLYLSPSQFSPNKLGINIDESAIGALKYESAFEGPITGPFAAD
jgi:hypothetical protein